MKSNYRFSFLLFSLLFIGACSKSDKITVDPNQKVISDRLSGLIYPRTPLDDYITSYFTNPYNIRVQYRFDESKANLLAQLVPTDTAKVRTTLDIFQTTLFQPYLTETQGDPSFLKKFVPKELVFIGSYQAQSDGSRILGIEGQGVRISLLNLNELDIKDSNQVREAVHTMHHEFGHALQNNIYTPQDFQQITPANYTSNWGTESLATAYSLGFITQYARASSVEDFVETISIYATQGKSNFMRIVKGRAGEQKILKKLDIARQYLSTNYGVNIDSLQSNTRLAINRYIKK